MPEFAFLSDPESPLGIEYSCAAMEKIRQRARDGLRALPRVGMGVGGLLLGVQKNGLVRVLDSIEIPCSHAGGPSFNLTDEEKQVTRELIAGAHEAAVIGLYCSRTRGPAALDDAEMALYGEFFPKPGQIALALRPSAAEPMRAAFFFRDKNGDTVKGIECDVEEWRADEVEVEVEPAPQKLIEEEKEIKPEKINTAPEVAVEEPLVIPEPVVVPRPVAPPRVEAPRVSAIPTPNRPPRPVQAARSDMFSSGAKPPRPKKRLVWILTAAAALVLGATAFFTQDLWIARPALTLSSAESNGNLVIRWNVEALRGIDRASMFVNDGGDLQSLPLDHFQLSQGVLIYSPKSQRVTAKLSAGDASAIAVWLAPPPPTPADTPPVTSEKPQTAPPAQDTAAKSVPASKPGKQ